MLGRYRVVLYGFGKPLPQPAPYPAFKLLFYMTTEKPLCDPVDKNICEAANRKTKALPVVTEKLQSPFLHLLCVALGLWVLGA